MDYKTIGITLLVISVAIFLEWIKIMSNDCLVENNISDVL